MPSGPAAPWPRSCAGARSRAGGGGFASKRPSGPTSTAIGCRGTTRAVDVDGGSQALVDGNAVFDGDSGCVLQRGAAGCQVSGNYWERCRVGLLAWGATGVHEQDNIAIDLHEPDHATITGP